MTIEQAKEESVYWLTLFTLLLITEQCQDWNTNRAGTWRQELMQRPWRGATHQYAFLSLLKLLSKRNQAHNGLGPPSLVTN